MSEDQKDTFICKSVFQEGANTTTEKAFTDMWIKLVNTLERAKNTKE